MNITPTSGRIVWYKMANYEAQQINKRRQDAQNKMDWHRALSTGAQIHIGNEVKAGQLYPAMIIIPWGITPESAVNLQVFLDGNDTYWATSKCVGEKEGDYQWMPYQLGQAAKTEEVLKDSEGKVPLTKGRDLGGNY